MGPSKDIGTFFQDRQEGELMDRTHGAFTDLLIDRYRDGWAVIVLRDAGGYDGYYHWMPLVRL